MTFKLKIKFEDRVIAKSKVKKIEDFDKIMDELKIKFNGRKG